MKQDAAMKWAEALESGKYKQGFGQLYDGTCFCALGVLCVVQGEEFVEGHGARFTRTGYYRYALPEEYMREKLDLRNSCQIISMNDHERLTFPEIAAYIRRNWEEL